MKSTRKAGIIGISAALLLSGALPAAAGPSILAAEGSASTNAASTAKPAASTDAAVSKPSSAQLPTDTKIKKDEAITLARQYAQVPEDYTVESVNFQAVPGGKVPGGSGSSWGIHFSKMKGDRYYGNISVSVHADTGKLLHFYSYSSDPESRPSYPPKTGMKDAKELAEAFIAKLYPAEFKETRYNTTFEENFRTPLNGDVRYTFRYDRTVNGIPFPNNGLSVSVDGNGMLTEFNYNWEADARFDDVSAALSKEKALELWKQQSKVVASYYRPYDNFKKEIPLIPAYQLNAVALDAVTGKVWPENNRSSDVTSPLTEKPLGSAPKPGGLLTQDQAIQAVTSTFKLPEGAVLENASYNESSMGPYGGKQEGTWNINWTVPEGKEKSKDTAKMLPSKFYIYAAVNATTGEILSFNSNPSYYPASQVEAKDEKVTYEAGKSQAEALVKKLLPYRTHQLVPVYQDPSAYPETLRLTKLVHAYTYKRVIDGMEAGGETVNISIDRKTGEVVSFNNGLSDTAYPDTKPALLDPAKALDLWLAQYSLELQYTVKNAGGGIYPYDIPIEKYNLMVAAGEIPPSTTGEKVSYSLIYTPVPKSQSTFNVFMDAVTGEWRTMNNGAKTVIGKVRASDTEGHWAGREMDLMVEYNALELTEGKVNPDKVATRGEMIKMLLTAMNGGYFYAAYDSARPASFADVKNGSSLFAYVENAVDRNLIDRNPDGNFNPDQPMTREEMAELIVRALGYNELAKKSSLFRLDIADSGSVTHQGHVALVLGLGIMSSSSDGLFLPQEEVTRAQAAVAFFRYLEQRGSLQSQPILY
ncbi:YcdB/YcdC domain-containing protein [Gorillibacterium sp. sgz5001074]|uniref:YcdB/YcdC domain-containing protein n=1 Tax=Gorillibacterium sp. sgz5001074 TaxID=3446695 RepID=UPI003F662B00